MGLILYYICWPDKTRSDCSALHYGRRGEALSRTLYEMIDFDGQVAFCTKRVTILILSCRHIHERLDIPIVSYRVPVN